MTEEAYEALRAAVTLARGGSVRSAADLKTFTMKQGHLEHDVDAALTFWGDDLRRRYPDAESFLAAHPKDDLRP